MERQFQSPRLFEGMELRGRSSLSPYPIASLTKTQSSIPMDHGDTDIFSSKSQNNECRLERDFGEDKSLFEDIKCRNSPQVFPFQNDEFFCNGKDVYVVFKVDGLPIQYDRKSPCKGRTTPYLQHQKSQENIKRKANTAFIQRKLSQNDMIVSGTRFSTSMISTKQGSSLCGTGKTTLIIDPTEDPRVVSDHIQHSKEEIGRNDLPVQITIDKLSEKSTRQPLQDIQNVWDKKLEKRFVSEFDQHSNDHDKEIEKLTRELREANTILEDIETNIYALKDVKDVGHQCLVSIKAGYRNLLEEKNICHKQISFIKKELNNYRIKDRRLVREFDQLNLCYGKLDQRERLMRRQISLMEAELSLVVSKLEAPKPSNVKPVVPRLDLSKLKQPKKLPPVKSPLCSLHKIKELQKTYPVVPNAPRKIYEIIKVYDSKDSPKMTKRRMWPQFLNSNPLLGNSAVKTIPSARVTGYDSLVVGNHCPLASRTEKETKSDVMERNKVIKLPSIDEEHQRKDRNSRKEGGTHKQDPFLSKLDDIPIMKKLP